MDDGSKRDPKAKRGVPARPENLLNDYVPLGSPVGDTISRP